uniref:Uncharacterized protein n=1 Tax=Sphaerodactylus townsendi TaxID=933632 RepID=A0ACB8FQB9_9SAUR
MPVNGVKEEGDKEPLIELFVKAWQRLTSLSVMFGEEWWIFLLPILFIVSVALAVTYMEFVACSSNKLAIVRILCRMRCGVVLLESFHVE